MNKIAPLFFSILSALVHAEVDPESIDPSLVILSQGFGYRILVYSICSPEHCWSNTYLQGVSYGSESPKINCSVPISEIEYGHSIEKVEWIAKGDKATAELSASASHGGFESRVVIITPSSGCAYKITGASETGF